MNHNIEIAKVELKRKTQKTTLFADYTIENACEKVYNELYFCRIMRRTSLYDALIEVEVSSTFYLKRGTLMKAKEPKTHSEAFLKLKPYLLTALYLAIFITLYLIYGSGDTQNNFIYNEF